MMNKQQAYNDFWRRFGVPAFEENSVPDDAVFNDMIKSGQISSKYPYITYQVLTDELDAPVFPTASIWDRSTSFKNVDLLSNQIAEYIKGMGTIKLDDGRMFIETGSPFSQHMIEEDTDTSIKRNVLNLHVEFFTSY